MWTTKDGTLIRAFLVVPLRPGVPCPTLGAGKTTARRITTALIDPRTGSTRGVPREFAI